MYSITYCHKCSETLLEDINVSLLKQNVLILKLSIIEFCNQANRIQKLKIDKILLLNYVLANIKLKTNTIEKRYKNKLNLSH